MMLQTNTSMCQQILGISWYHQQEHQFPFGLACPLSCFANCLYAYNLTGLKKLHSKVKNGHKGCNYKRMSSKMVEIVDSSAFTKGNMKNLPLSSEYEAAMEALSSLITRKKRGDKSHAPLSYNKLDMVLMYLKILGLEEHITGLKIIHVAGTKGKGSTCAFCEAILRGCGFRTGLFTSPHLIDVRERFRLDGLDISEDKFLLYFWECWNQLKEKVTVDLPMPPLFQFLTVLAFKIFVSEKVDVAIIEVGLGGREDSTNVIKEPIVCGITSLGMDHTEVLGNTLAEIALHKAGIFKCQIPAFTVPQLSEAMLVLKERAHQLMVPLEVAAPLDYKKLNKLKLSLSGDHQLVNAGLAVSLCKSWLQSTGSWEKLFRDHDILEDNLPEAFLRGLSTALLSGRSEVFNDSFPDNSSEVTEDPSGGLTFYLDGAHSPESMEACAKWFSNAVKENKNTLLSSPLSSKVGNITYAWGNGYIKPSERESNIISKQILLFNCMEVRDPQILLPQLVNTCASSGTHFSNAIFVPNISTYNKVTSGASVTTLDIPARDLSWQFNLQRIWKKIINGKDSIPGRPQKISTTDNLPSREFLYGDVCHGMCADKCLPRSMVIPSLPLAINWLRDCARENPSLKIQVLVTGSLHLVGDVLKIIRR